MLIQTFNQGFKDGNLSLVVSKVIRRNAIGVDKIGAYVIGAIAIDADAIVMDVIGPDAFGADMIGAGEKGPYVIIVVPRMGDINLFVHVDDLSRLRTIVELRFKLTESFVVSMDFPSTIILF